MGSGRVRSPSSMTMMFLRRQPYFPPGSLRAALAFPAEPSEVSDSDIEAALERVALSHLSDPLDRKAQWGLELTEDEQVRSRLRGSCSTSRSGFSPRTFSMLFRKSTMISSDRSSRPTSPNPLSSASAVAYRPMTCAEKLSISPTARGHEIAPARVFRQKLAMSGARWPSSSPPPTWAQ